ncbi:MAG: hypothetical protein ABL933_08850 [Methyloglobulus sp.]|nr:hypothetical protein [Methyloglobulus sp.]
MANKDKSDPKILKAVQFLTGPAQAPGKPITGSIDCARLETLANAYIEKNCSQKVLDIDSLHPCGGGVPSAQKVDLVILIDTSGSMSDEATGLSNAADAAVTAAKKKCAGDLRVEYLGLSGIWIGTKFTTTLETYLTGKGVPVASLLSLGGAGDPQENGARGIEDLAKFFDWRAGAQRAIFYLSDEGLEGGDPQDAADVSEATNAINAANAATAKVFTYAGTGIGAATQAEYARVATNTGGQAFVNPVASLGGFQTVLENIICASTGAPGCAPAKLPELRPCFHIKWGDSNKDQIESEDFEVLCIEARNPYTNVVLKDVTVIIGVVVHKNGMPVEKLPDGTPSILLKPDAQICFGDLEVCDPTGKDDRSVSREVVLKTANAVPGDYSLLIAVCFGIEYQQVVEERFNFTLIAS